MHGAMMDYPLTLQMILRRAHEVFPEKEVVTRREDGRIVRTTYGALHGRVVRLMHALRTLGIRPGERVASFAWNSQRHLELYFAVPCLGAVLHTLNVRLARAQIAGLVRHADDRLIFVERGLVPLLAPLATEFGPRVRFVVLDDDGRGAEQGLADALDYETLLAEASAVPDFPALDERQAAGLCYTSATTGEPKGVLTSHRSTVLHAMGAGMVDSMGVGQRDTVLPIVPMFHASAWGFPLASAFTGAKLVLPGPQLGGDALLELIEGERVTLAAGVPTVWSLMLRALEKRPRDVSSLRDGIIGGAAAPLALLTAWHARHGLVLTHAWGMTETSPVGCCSRLKSATLALPLAEQLAARVKQGVPVPGIEARILDDEGRELPRDGRSLGELCVRGPWVVARYFGEDTPSASFTADGWFRTGDVASIDALGYIAIADRKKDLVKSRGEWISSVAMENEALLHAGVLEAAVTARSDALRGEAPVLWLVPSDAGRPPTPTELLELLARRFARWQLPRPEDVRFVGELPKTSVGKLDKKALRARDVEG